MKKYIVSWDHENYIVSWDHENYGKAVKLYYQGWSQQNGKPMYSPVAKDAKQMSRSGALHAAMRLRDPRTWGVPAEVSLVSN